MPLHVPVLLAAEATPHGEVAAASREAVTEVVSDDTESFFGSGRIITNYFRTFATDSEKSS